MPEVAVNVPFEAQEVIEIAVQEFRKRLQGLSPLQGGKEYTKFKICFADDIFLWRMGEQEPRKTLAWGDVARGDNGDPLLEATDVVLSCSEFESKDPNEERMAREMPLTVESPDGKGGKARRKVRVKG